MLIPQWAALQRRMQSGRGTAYHQGNRATETTVCAMLSADSQKAADKSAVKADDKPDVSPGLNPRMQIKIGYRGYLIDYSNCLLCISVMLMFAGCASVSTQPPAAGTPSDAIPAHIGRRCHRRACAQTPVSENRAVIALLDRARLDNGTGQREAAGASLERALRIERAMPVVA